MNAARAMNVHPTALALALRNQQYQMARAAAVAAATAAVNRPPVFSPAQAAAAAMMLNQQRATGGFHGIMPQVNPRMFSHPPQRPNLPPALQGEHHVVHHSGEIAVVFLFIYVFVLVSLEGPFKYRRIVVERALLYIREFELAFETNSNTKTSN